MARVSFNVDNMFAEFFWIGVFSLTAKAALSISYDDKETNPVYCKMMCLIGLVYCFLVDRSLFVYAFTPEQVALGASIAALTLIMLCMHAQVFNRQKEMTEAEENNQQ